MHDDSHDGHALPLKGVVLCSTSLAQDVRVGSTIPPGEDNYSEEDYLMWFEQTLLAEMSDTMGAMHRLDLTTDVTHLIVGNIDTPKYKHVAKERPDILVLRPEWIQAMRDAWRSGKDVDVQKLEVEYRLPTLYGLQISVTGFEDLEQRQAIVREIEEQGGTYNGDLTKIVTHLIVKTPSGPKYERARLWGLRTVSLRWFEETLERGMVLEEALYDPLRPVEMQGQGAYVKEYKTLKRSREEAGASFAEENGKRKLRRSKSARLNNDSQSMWAGMSMIEDIMPVKKEDEWNEPSHSMEHIPFAPQEATASRDITPSIPGGDITRPVLQAAVPAPAPVRSLFSDCLFVVTGHPEKRSQKILEILRNEGGQIADFPEDLYAAVESESHSTTALIIPSEWTASTGEPLPDVPSDTLVVTEWWIERCIISKSIVDPAEDVYSRSRLNLPGDCFIGMILSTSGLGNDAKHVYAITKYTGAAYEENFKPTCSVLITRTPDTNPEKIEYALKHNVPIVSEDWLLHSLDRGENLPLEHYQTPASKANNAKQKRATRQEPDPPLLQKRKDDSLAQRLSTTRKRGVTPSLMLVKSRSAQIQPKPITTLAIETKMKPATTMPFVEEDDDDSVVDEPPPAYAEAQLDGAHSQPLTEVSRQVVNSPERLSQQALNRRQSVARDLQDEPVDDSVLVLSNEVHAQAQKGNMDPPPNENVAPRPHTGSISVPDDNLEAKPAEANKIRLSEDIKSLLDRRKEAPSPVEAYLPGRRRKERKLGRATSNTSNPSAPASFTHGRSIEIANSTASASPLDLGMPLPSQQLGYEAVDAKEHRAKMSKKMGTKFGDDGFGVRVESIGVVKDADSGEAGVGTRVRGRHRNAKA